MLFGEPMAYRGVRYHSMVCINLNTVDRLWTALSYIDCVSNRERSQSPNNRLSSSTWIVMSMTKAKWDGLGFITTSIAANTFSGASKQTDRTLARHQFLGPQLRSQPMAAYCGKRSGAHRHLKMCTCTTRRGYIAFCARQSAGKKSCAFGKRLLSSIRNFSRHVRWGDTNQVALHWKYLCPLIRVQRVAAAAWRDCPQR